VIIVIDITNIVEWLSEPTNCIPILVVLACLFFLVLMLVKPKNNEKESVAPKFKSIKLKERELRMIEITSTRVMGMILGSNEFKEEIAEKIKEELNVGSSEVKIELPELAKNIINDADLIEAIALRVKQMLASEETDIFPVFRDDEETLEIEPTVECPYCNAVIGLKDIFCGQCGKRIIPDKEAPDPVTSSKKTTKKKGRKKSETSAPTQNLQENVPQEPKTEPSPPPEPLCPSEEQAEEEAEEDEAEKQARAVITNGRKKKSKKQAKKKKSTKK